MSNTNTQTDGAEGAEGAKGAEGAGAEGAEGAPGADWADRTSVRLTTCWGTPSSLISKSAGFRSVDEVPAFVEHARVDLDHLRA